jgi:hypothetical protein
VAVAQLARLSNPSAGFDPLLERRMRLVLGPCREQGTRILTNGGAANPVAAGERIVAVALAPRRGRDRVRGPGPTGPDVLSARLEATEIDCLETRLDILGVNSLFGEALGRATEPPEARVRLAVHVASREEAELAVGLADGLTLGAPYGGGGPTLVVREIIAVCSVYLPRADVRPSWTILEG